MESEKIEAFGVGKAWKSLGILVNLRRKGSVEALQEGATDKHCSCSFPSTIITQWVGKWQEARWSVRCVGMKLDMGIPSGPSEAPTPNFHKPSLIQLAWN
jgi:hypothetical protein